MTEALAKILVADDEPDLRALLQRYLSDQGYSVRTVDGAGPLDVLLQRERFDVLVLDVMMPGEDGLSICRRLRAQGETIPILMLTARGDPVDRIVGLEMGADDYLPKPFDPRELILRISNILRRGGPQNVPKVEQIVFGPYTFQIAKRELKRGGEALRLTDREQEILAIFAGRAGETIPRHELVAGESEVGERTIDVQINRLRRKIERDPSNPVWLQTVRGIGYRLSVE